MESQEDDTDGLAEAVRQGWLKESSPNADGEPTYKLTEEGRARVEALGLKLTD